MKILLVAKPWKGGLARYLAMALEDFFPGAVSLLATYPASLNERLRYTADKDAWKKALTLKIKRQSYDIAIFINCLSNFRELDYSPRHILWLTDGPRPQAAALKPYGRIFLSDRGYEKAVTAVAEADRFFGELPFAHCIFTHCPPARPARRPKPFCFIGNQDLRRDGQLAYLFRAGIFPTIVGNYFMRHRLFWQHPFCFRPAVSNDRMGDVYARHRLSLNIHAAIVRQGTNMRTFEAGGYGIPQLVEYRPGLENYFEPGREIAVYHEKEEIPSCLSRLLADQTGLAVLAARARQRALAQHTYHHRVARLLEGFIPADLVTSVLARLPGTVGKVSI